MARAAKKDSGGRGSAEAIEKRRVARQLNTVFSGKVGGANKLDGRTAKRRLRLLKELKEGRGGRALKAIEVVSHANELLEMGEALSAIRKNGVKAPKIEVDDATMKLVARTQAAYGFRPEAWRLLGVQLGGEAKSAKKPAAKKRGRARG